MSINVTIEFNEAAFTHNVTEEDIRFAFDTARYDGRIDALSADYLFSKAIAEHKTPAELISEMVQERLVVAQ